MQQNQSPHYTFREGRLNFPFRTIRLQPSVGQIVTARTGIRAYKVGRLDARTAIACQTVMRENRRFRVKISNARKPYLATLAACRLRNLAHPPISIISIAARSAASSDSNLDDNIMFQAT